MEQKAEKQVEVQAEVQFPIKKQLDRVATFIVKPIPGLR